MQPPAALARTWLVPRLLTLALLLPSLAACSPAGLVNALVPRDGYALVEGLAYGDGARRRLDLYLPVMPGPAPVVVFFYGGSWQAGNRGDFRFVGQALAERGYVVAIPDYRLYPEVAIAGILEDAAAAVAWIAEHGAQAAKRPLAPLFLMGHSAGAYNAVMLTLDAQWLGRLGRTPCDTIRATVGLAGPYDFLPLRDRTLMAIFGPEPDRPRTQPVAWARGDAPPLLLVTGDDDLTVRPRNTDSLAARVAAEGGEVTVRHYPGVGHLTLVGALAHGLRWYAPVLDDIDAWLQRQAERSAPTCRDAAR
jgi:acetyl esterase/lipase